MFGDGSSGPLNVLSGTHALALNTKHQFSSVHVAAGAVLTTNDQEGAVLYITARESITIDGVIDVSGRVRPGKNGWAVIIDGVSYESPGVSPGGFYGESGQSGNGFGAGGYGARVNTTGGNFPGGVSSPGGEVPSAGSGRHVSRNASSDGHSGLPGLSGSWSGGGGGGAWAWVDPNASSGTSAYANSAWGAGGHGQSGGDGSGGGSNGSSSAGGWGWSSGGGGGGGGLAGRAGVHVVLKAPVIIINGQIITAGSNGGNGGNGGRSQTQSGWTNQWGGPGLGGGGGFGGDISLTWAQTLDWSGTFNANGGAGGVHGYGNTGFVQTAGTGGNGGSGRYSTQRITDPAQYATNLEVVSIDSEEAFGTPALIPDPLNLTAGSIPSGQSFDSDHLLSLNTTATSVSSSEAFSTDGAVTLSAPPPPPATDWEAIGKEDQKTYVHRIYQPDGTFIGIWVDAEGTPSFTQRINTPGTTMSVALSRSPRTTKEVQDVLVTQAGDVLTTQDNTELAATYETNNSVGEGTDVDIDLLVDTYVHYGEFDNLATQAGEFFITQDGEEIVAATGAPMGKRIFSGYILDYESLYGQTNGVTVTVISNGEELSQELVRSGETIVINYGSGELANTLKSVIATNPGKMTYSEGSIDNTGVSAPFKFMLNSKLEAIESIYSQTPDGFYWFGDVATNQLVMKQKSATPDHLFVLGHHIKEMALKRSAEQRRTVSYFVGGEDAGTGISVLKKYLNPSAPAGARQGLHRITDRRYSVPASMQRRAYKEMGDGRPMWTTTVTISAARYDIETIQLGQVIGFLNDDNFLQDLQLQIMSKTYEGTQVSLQVGGFLDTQADIINGIAEAIENEQFQTIPNAPS